MNESASQHPSTDTGLQRIFLARATACRHGLHDRRLPAGRYSSQLQCLAALTGMLVAGALVFAAPSNGDAAGATDQALVAPAPAQVVRVSPVELHPMFAPYGGGFTEREPEEGQDKQAVPATLSAPALAGEPKPDQSAVRGASRPVPARRPRVG